jgi:hypothetical protein
MRTWMDHRKAIMARLEDMGKTRYWLAQQLEGKMQQNMLYAYLRGKNTSSDKLEAIFEVVGLRLTDAGVKEK